jgi:hypothetical protein
LTKKFINTANYPTKRILVAELDYISKHAKQTKLESSGGKPENLQIMNEKEAEKLLKNLKNSKQNKYFL